MFRPERVQLRFSVALALLLGATHLTAIAIVIAVVPDLYWQLLLLVVVFGQWLYLAWRHLWLLHPLSVVTLRWTHDGWFLQLRDGRELCVEPTSACRLYSRVCLLQFKAIAPDSWRERSFNLWLFPDSGSESAIRRMRVQLNLSGSSQN